MLTFVLAMFEDDKNETPCWYEVADGKDYFINWAGGRLPISCLKVVRKAQANEFGDLDWSGTILDDSKQDAGYLSREGRFYGCAPRMHISCASFVLKKTASELDDQGWAHIYGPPRNTEDEHNPVWLCMKTLSAEQRNWLVKRGYLVNDWD